MRGEATERASSPTRRVTSRPARAVSPCRSGNSGWRSVKVRCGQWGSGQEKRRLDHTTRTRRPKAGRSRITTRRRSFVLAITPQEGQPAAWRGVSTPTSSSAPSSTTAVTVKPGSPTNRSRNPVPSDTAGASSRLAALDSHENDEVPRRGGGSLSPAHRARRAPQFIEKSR